MNKSSSSFLFFFALIASSIVGCGSHSNNSKNSYMFVVWNFALQDSVKIEFSLDSIFKPGGSHIGCFDDGTECHVFETNTSTITMNFRGLGKKEHIRSFEEQGEIQKNKFKDSYPEGKVIEPKLVSSESLNGAIIECITPSVHLIRYSGSSDKMYMTFSIYLETKSETINGNDILVSLAKSITIERKK